MKIRPVKAELFQAGGQSDMTNLIAALRKFCERASKRHKEDMMGREKGRRTAVKETDRL